MAAKKISLILGSHAYIPYGADSSEFENVYSNQIKPFISALYKYPRIQAVLHYSGVLLHWIERSHPELFMLIEDMIIRKQVEMLGSGFYEPVLPIIPLQDKIGQTELLTTYLRRQFGRRPQGCWIPNFAWEQNLVSPLAACGIAYTFLSEKQFALAGGGGTPCICEDQGKLITVFPVMQSLEAELEAKSVSAVLMAYNEDSGRQRDANSVVSIFPHKPYADKDEKCNHIWNRFFEELSLCEEFVETISPGRILKNLSGLPKLYFTDSNSSGIVSARRFIIDHPEASGIYAKMIFTNLLITQLRGDKSRKLSAREEIWKAQGSALFSLAGKSGLHNNMLRNAAYSALLEAERVIREKSKFVPSLIPFDLNLDGADEWLFQDAKINCYVQAKGGGVFELDYLPKSWNYLDTCAGRLAFSDRLLPISAKNIMQESNGRICRKEEYVLADIDKVHRKLHLALHEGTGQFGSVKINKNFAIKKETLSVGYSLINSASAKTSFIFSPEIDLAFPGEGDAFTRFFTCKQGAADAPITDMALQSAEGVKIFDIVNEVQINLAATEAFNGQISPVYLTDAGTGEKLFQAYCVMPAFSVTLDPGQKWDVEFLLKFSH